MPNKFQFAFLTSFTVVLFSLVGLSHFVRSKLRDAGYDISNLILIGLPKPEPIEPAAPMDLNQLKDQALAFYKTLDVASLTSSPLFLITSALVLAAAFLTNFLTTGRLKL